MSTPEVKRELLNFKVAGKISVNSETFACPYVGEPVLIDKNKVPSVTRICKLGDRLSCSLYNNPEVVKVCPDKIQEDKYQSQRE